MLAKNGANLVFKFCGDSQFQIIGHDFSVRPEVRNKHLHAGHHVVSDWELEGVVPGAGLGWWKIKVSHDATSGQKLQNIQSQRNCGFVNTAISCFDLRLRLKNKVTDEG